MNGRYAIVLSITALVLAIASGAFAAGGVYIDDVRITNNGRQVLFDNFNDGTLNAWASVSQAIPVRVSPESSEYLLHMNRHERTSASMMYRMPQQPIGVFELSALVYIALAQEQADYRLNRTSDLLFRLTSAAARGTITAGVKLYAKDQGNKVDVVVLQLIGQQQNTGSDRTKTSVLPCEKWATITLRLDPATRTATVLLDGNTVASTQYDPNSFPGFRMLTVLCGYGDGELDTLPEQKAN